MNKIFSRKSICATILAAPMLLIVGCGGGGSSNDFDGAVFAMTNGSPVNSVVAYGRSSDGTLTLIGTEDSEGAGTGPNNVATGPGGNVFDPLASNFSLIMSDDDDFVFAVNAGSDEISSFEVNSDFSLTHISTVASGGSDPISVASVGDIVYALNSNEGIGTMQGFTFNGDGELTSIANSLITLTGRPTTVRFTNDGEFLLVTEIDTNILRSYSINDDDTLIEAGVFEYGPQPDGRNSPNPFGLDTFARDGQQFMAIGEARVFTAAGEAAPQTSSVSTFQVGDDGAITVVSLDVRADNDGDDSVGPITTCWVISNESGDQLVTANTFGNSLSSFTTSATGSATLNVSEAFSVTGEFADTGLTDQIFIGDNVYQMLASTGEIVSFDLDANGSLIEIDRDADLVLTGGNQGIAGF